MQVKRCDDAEIKNAFENWKKSAKLKIKEFNTRQISKEELLYWMIENRDFK